MCLVGELKMIKKTKKEIKSEERKAKRIINSLAFKSLVKAGFSERKAFKIMRGY